MLKTVVGHQPATNFKFLSKCVPNIESQYRFGCNKLVVYPGRNLIERSSRAKEHSEIDSEHEARIKYKTKEGSINFRK